MPGRRGRTTSAWCRRRPCPGASSTRVPPSSTCISSSWQSTRGTWPGPLEQLESARSHPRRAGTERGARLYQAEVPGHGGSRCPLRRRGTTTLRRRRLGTLRRVYGTRPASADHAEQLGRGGRRSSRRRPRGRGIPPGMLAELARMLLDAVAPRRCAGCDAVSDPPICAGCAAVMSAMPVPQVRRMRHGSAHAGFEFAEPVRAALHRGKYGGDRRVLLELAAMTSARLSGPRLFTPDAVVAVPTRPATAPAARLQPGRHPGRRHRRGARCAALRPAQPHSRYPAPERS